MKKIFSDKFLKIKKSAQFDDSNDYRVNNYSDYFDENDDYNDDYLEEEMDYSSSDNDEPDISESEKYKMVQEGVGILNQSGGRFSLRGSLQDGIYTLYRDNNEIISSSSLFEIGDTITSLMTEDFSSDVEDEDYFDGEDIFEDIY